MPVICSLIAGVQTGSDRRRWSTLPGGNFVLRFERLNLQGQQRRSIGVHNKNRRVVYAAGIKLAGSVAAAAGLTLRRARIVLAGVRQRRPLRRKQ